MTDKVDLDYDTIDGIDDADDESLFLLVKDRITGDYGWHWVYRDNLADYGLYDLARTGLSDVDADSRGWLR
ncbi:hypothetical protein V1290_004417 [Bradyrhizobium sp. AZCC 1578]|uniref:hypothetical protein n=1 Tax=Bradyrhizobium sp. AZCC 1578 TaxID=3117027 RepID=UPI002FEF08AD